MLEIWVGLRYRVAIDWFLMILEQVVWNWIITLRIAKQIAFFVGFIDLIHCVLEEALKKGGTNSLGDVPCQERVENTTSGECGSLPQGQPSKGMICPKKLSSFHPGIFWRCDCIKALSKLVWLQSWLCFEKTGMKTFRLSYSLSLHSVFASPALRF